MSSQKIQAISPRKAQKRQHNSLHSSQRPTRFSCKITALLVAVLEGARLTDDAQYPERERRQRRGPQSADIALLQRAGASGDNLWCDTRDVGQGGDP